MKVWTVETATKFALEVQSWSSNHDVSWPELDSKNCGTSREVRRWGIFRISSKTRFWATSSHYLVARSSWLFLHIYALQLLGLYSVKKHTKFASFCTSYCVLKLSMRGGLPEVTIIFRWCQQFVLSGCVQCSAEASHSTQSAEQQQKESPALLCSVSFPNHFKKWVLGALLTCLHEKTMYSPTPNTCIRLYSRSAFCEAACMPQTSGRFPRFQGTEVFEGSNT